MSINKLALMRYKALDDCLRNRRRKWTLEDLIEKVSELLHDREGIRAVSRRTIQADLQVMRSDKLGYNAPIIVTDKKYYSYEDPDYSITNAPINSADVEKMKEIVGMLKQLNGFSYFEEMSEMIARLENNLYKASSPGGSCIQFEDNHRLKGREHLGALYQATLNQRPLLLDYQSFKALKPQQKIYYPYLLKEYRNRWFLIARAKNSQALATLALDRMVEFQELPNERFVPYEGEGFDAYFGALLGVTRNEKDKPRKVVLRVDGYNAPYVLTKPLHPSQEVLKQDDSGVIIRIDVVLNFELEREILGFGECMKVLSPRDLQNRINRRLEAAARQYRGEGGPAESESA